MVTLCFFKKTNPGLPPRCRSPVPVDRLDTNGTTPDRGFLGGSNKWHHPGPGFLGGSDNGPGTPDTGPVPVASPVEKCTGETTG
jgi:hypothetical protein